MLYKKYQRITYSEGVIRASFQIFKKVLSNFPEMLARQAVQLMDILFQNDLKVKFITAKSCKMNQGFKLLFLLKKGRISKKGTSPIFARVTIDGKRIEWSLQRSCEPFKWNQDKGRANGTKTETLQLNSFLNTIQGAILEVQNEYAIRKEQLDISVFRSKFIDKNEKQIQTLLQIYQDHNDQFEKLTVTQYSWGTFKKFKSALYSLKKFIQWKYKKPDVSLNEINHQFIKDYEFYCMTSSNPIAKSIGHEKQRTFIFMETYGIFIPLA